MDQFIPKNTKKGGPEQKIQDAIKSFLEEKDWVVMVTHGNLYQHGFPDLYCMHPKYGTRWIEVKNPEGYSFTSAQRRTFPKFTHCNVGIWILVAATEEEYEKLFKPANWHQFLGKSSVDQPSRWV